MVLGCINRTAWGTKLLLTAVWASLVDCISLCYLMKAQNCSLSPKGYFNRVSLISGMEYGLEWNDRMERRY